ncbi:MAG TPA: NAD-dependent epimerase/dehydratase family protein [Bryobacteraceae bacterium]|jgi:CDP-paratose 2-epimerase|nr:NAD-dependent epimerase/dehydratase family protein [Bryobacteraceae bacterium]
MKILITGICGFVGNRVAKALKERSSDLEIAGIDNLLRPGSEMNRSELAHFGIHVVHGDLRMRSDVDALPDSDYVIDGAANPSVLAGVDGRSSPRQLCEHNLAGTLNLLEYCRERKAGLVLLSTNRVYSVKELAGLPVVKTSEAFEVDTSARFPKGLSTEGLSEIFSIQQPISLYGATKLASEVMAIEYGAALGFPVWINRCGVLAGAGQFGTAEQGIFSYWLHAHAARRPLRYIGFGGNGFQVRDAFHPVDLAELILIQLRTKPPADAIFHAGGGRHNAMSLAQLTAWANERFGPHQPSPDLRPRPFDAPWIVMDCRRAAAELGWVPKLGMDFILNEIAEHVHANPDWLARCGVL